MANEPIEITRMFNLPDGTSTTEWIKVAMDQGARGASKLFAGGGVSFARLPAGDFLDWHPMRQRTLTILIQGRVEITTGDGQKRVREPGDVGIAEDLNGRGHTGRSLGPDDAVFIFIPLDPDTRIE